MKTKALFIDFKEQDISSKYLNRLKGVLSSYQFVASNDSSLDNLLIDVEIIFAQIDTKLGKEIIDRAPNLKYIGVLATAYDAIDINRAKEKGIVVCNLGGYSTEAVAEFFFASLFDVARELERAKQQARKGDYDFSSFMGTELKDKTLGVIGAGKIGSRIAEIGLGVGMNVIYFSRTSKPEIEKRGASKKKLNEVLSQSDFLSMNLSLNSETEEIINEDNINLIKKNGILINLAPLELIKPESLFEKLKTNDMTYVFDHSDFNPKLAREFAKYKNVVIYPPIAFRTAEANTAKWETFVANVEGFVNGNPKNVVNI